MTTMNGTGASRTNRGRPKNGLGSAAAAGFTRGEPLDLAGRRVLVVGLARTGLETANFLARRGAFVTVTDRKDPAALGPALARLDSNVRRELGAHRLETFRAQDLVVPSPGMAMDDPLLLGTRAVMPAASRARPSAVVTVLLPLVPGTASSGSGRKR